MLKLKPDAAKEIYIYVYMCVCVCVYTHTKKKKKNAMKETNGAEWRMQGKMCIHWGEAFEQRPEG